MDFEGALFFLHSTFKRRLIISWSRWKIFNSNLKVHEGGWEREDEQAKNRSHWDKYRWSPCYHVDHEEKYEEPVHCSLSKFLLHCLEWLHSTYFGSKANKNRYIFFSFHFEVWIRAYLTLIPTNTDRIRQAFSRNWLILAERRVCNTSCLPVHAYND